MKIMSAKEAVLLVKSGMTIASDGFVGAAFPEELALALEQRFQETSAPENLTLVFCAGQGDGNDKGLNHLGHKGLLGRVIGGHWGLVPKIQRLALANQIEAYNLPQGVISHLFRDIAAKKPGTITRVGLNTFVDPRLGGGKLNSRTKLDIVDLLSIDGKDYLLYRYLPIHCALLRGTSADENGNISMEKEGVTAEMLSIAQAVRNSGGIVIVQVESLVKTGNLNPKSIKIPGIYVDVVVVASKPEYHSQTFTTVYNPAYSGEARAVLGAIPVLPLDERKVICRRAFLEIHGQAIANLGIGMPEGIALVAAEEGQADNLKLTVESGPIGGTPAAGGDFGCSWNAEAIIDQPYQFDFYHGGGLDIAFLGLAQVDQTGNVNVSKFSDKITGCGGFIDITQNAKEVVYCGTFTAKGLQIDFDDGKLKIVREGTVRKFIKEVEQITFSGTYAAQNMQPVVYVTERAVFRLTEDGLMLTEIAPGVDLEKDILAQMDFLPLLHPNIQLMDKRLFKEEKLFGGEPL